jgi:hypothetical protein
MSKITFRADDDLVERIESLDASKSEVMREALRAYLDAPEKSNDERSLDAVVADRVDELVNQRLAADEVRMRDTGRDINVNVTLDGSGTGRTREESSVRTEDANRPEERTRRTTADTERTEIGCSVTVETNSGPIGRSAPVVADERRRQTF